MKILKNLFMLSLTALFFSGCIEVQTHVNVNKDGSGTINEKVLFSKEMVSLLSSFNVSDSTGSKGKSGSPFYDVEKLKSEAGNMGEGVKYISSKEIKEDGRVGYEAVYGFKDLNKIKVSENPEAKTLFTGSKNDKNKKKEYITFNFTRGTFSQISINLPNDKTKKAKPESETKKDTSNMNNPFAMQFLNMLKDFRFSLDVNVNGKIKSTNASYVKGSKVTLFDVEFDKLMKNKNDVDKLYNLRNSDPEETKKLLKKIPGIKIEMENPVKIKFD